MSSLKKEGEFGSRAWGEACAAASVKILEAANLPEGFEWAFTECYTHPPARLMEGGREKAGYFIMVKDGKITGLWCHTTADHGAFDACADPTKFPAGFMNICTGSYDIPTAYLAVDGIYTNKAPGGVAYRCSFRVTEASDACYARLGHATGIGLLRRARSGWMNGGTPAG